MRRVLAGEELPELSEEKKVRGQEYLSHDAASNSYSALYTGSLSVKKSKKDASAMVKVAPSSTGNKYFPRVNEIVIGRILSKHPEQYTVDVNAFSPATLEATAFEGATRRNKPNLEIGNLVYARVDSIDIATKKATLSCISPTCKKAWTTGESFFRELKGGFLVECSAWLVQYLLREECHLLKRLSEHFVFDIFIGINGRVVVTSTGEGAEDRVLIVSLCIQRGEERLSKKQIDLLVASFLKQ